MKIKKISDTCVSSIDMNRFEVCLEGHEAAFRYRDDSLSTLLQKAMTRKATFITKDGVIDWITLKKDVPIRDVTEVLSTSEENYWNLLELSSNAIVTVDLRGVITSINEAGEKMLGYSKDETVGKHVWKIGHLPVKEIPKYKKKLAYAIAGKTPKPFEATWYRRDGTPYVVEIRAGFLKKNDERTGLQIVIRDITERKRVEKAFGEPETKFRRIFESARDCMIIMDRAGRIVDVNRKAVEVFGGSKKEMLGKHFTKTSVVSPADIPKFISRFAKILAGTRCKQVILNVRIKNKKGQMIPLECSSSTVKKNGKITGILVVAKDITERERTEKELRESEEKFRSLAEQSPNMIFMSQKNRIIYVNKKCEEIMGYKKKEFCSPDFNLSLVFAPESLNQTKSVRRRLMKGEEVAPLEYTLGTKEGRKIDIIVKSKLIEYEGEPTILGVVTDVTQRKKIEEEAKRIKDEYLGITNLIDDIVVHVDKEGKWTFLNDGASEFWGKPKEKLMKTPFANYLHPDDQERTRNIIQEILKNKKTVKGFVNRQKTPKGWRMVQWNAAPLFDEAGDFVGIQATGKDITEHK